ncbi:hypothetical protein FRB90_009039, partial [Tulasnella sp. 427]
MTGQSSEPLESKGSPQNSDPSASSPPPLKKRRQQDYRSTRTSFSPEQGSPSGQPSPRRFAAPGKWKQDSNHRRDPKPRKHRRAEAEPRPVDREREPNERTFRYKDHKKYKSKNDSFRNESRDYRPLQFVPGKPSKAYLKQADIPSHRSEPLSLVTESTQSKLLILDLNGTLLFRKKLPNGIRRPYPRPYVPAFLSWIFHQDNALETMIWSSAQPENVKKMVGECFGEEYETQLRAVWARDTLGLSKAQYYQKVQTVKNLEVVWDKLPYSVRNTVLVDDSPLKAHMQPFNHI